jgi:hypothetical protein
MGEMGEMDWLALITPPLIWVKAAWLSPFLRTHRHGLSAALSLITGVLMFACFRVQEPAASILFWIGAATTVAMLTALLWPEAKAKRKGS